MAGNPNDESIGLLTGEESTEAPRAAPAAPGAPAVAPTPAKPAAPAPKPEIPGLLTFRAADDLVREVTAGTVTTLSAVLTSAHAEPGPATVTIEVAYTSTYPGEGAEWPVSWMPPGKRSFLELVSSKEKATVTLNPNTPVAFSFEVTAPVGVRYGDRVEIRL